jgi:acylphosphatase
MNQSLVRSGRRRLAALCVMIPCLAFPVTARGDDDKPDKKDGAKPAKAVMVHYSGDVQGVGFRATTAAIAKDYPVTGWVKNLPDGRVQLLVEGPEDAVDKFLAAVRIHWKKNITREDVEGQTPTGKLEGFKVVE